MNELQRPQKFLGHPRMAARANELIE